MRNPIGILFFGSLKQNFKIDCWENSEHTQMFWILPHPSGALPPRNKRLPSLKPLNNRPSNDEWRSFGNGVQNFKEQTSEISHGIINHKNTPTPHHPLHKIATEIEENIIKESKLYFPKLALGKTNFVDWYPRLSNTSREHMYTRTGLKCGVKPGCCHHLIHQLTAHH